MAASMRCFFSNRLGILSTATETSRNRRLKPLRCEKATERRPERITVGSGKESLEICRVVNGMWQTSGGWGRIDGDEAVDAMLRHPTRDSPPSTWPTSTDLLRIFMAFSSIEFVESARQVRGRDYSNPGYLDALKHLTDIKEEGMIKTLALTNFDTEKLQIIIENGIPIVSNQVQHSIIDMRPQQRMAELCQLEEVWNRDGWTAIREISGDKIVNSFCCFPFKHPFSSEVQNGIPSYEVSSHHCDMCKIGSAYQMVDAGGGWSLFQDLLQTLKKITSKHGVSIPTVAVKYILDQGNVLEKLVLQQPNHTEPTVAGSMVGVRLGLSEHIQDTNAAFSLILYNDDKSSIEEISKKGKDLLTVIGDCSDEYRH